MDVRSVKMTIDYNPQTNEYLLEKQRELKAELETLDPDSDRRTGLPRAICAMSRTSWRRRICITSRNV